MASNDPDPAEQRQQVMATPTKKDRIGGNPVLGSIPQLNEVSEEFCDHFAQPFLLEGHSCVRDPDWPPLGVPR
ncbi:MAG: hypothetical protein AB7E81_25075 [Hyphomicrobiaceae bacterium]